MPMLIPALLPRQRRARALNAPNPACGICQRQSQRCNSPLSPNLRKVSRLPRQFKRKPAPLASQKPKLLAPLQAMTTDRRRQNNAALRMYTGAADVVT